MVHYRDTDGRSNIWSYSSEQAANFLLMKLKGRTKRVQFSFKLNSIGMHTFLHLSRLSLYTLHHLPLKSCLLYPFACSLSANRQRLTPSPSPPILHALNEHRLSSAVECLKRKL